MRIKIRRVVWRALPSGRPSCFYCGDMARPTDSDIPEPFTNALTSLRTAARTVDLELTEIPGPTRAAAYSVALSGSLADPDDPETEIADGNFVVLYNDADDGGPGSFKVIVMIRAELDAEMSIDPLLPDVAWTWLEEALARFTGSVDDLGGAVTRTITTNHGRTAEHGDSVELELRASWASQSSEVGDHLQAWGQALRTCAGQPVHHDGVTTLHSRM